MTLQSAIHSLWLAGIACQVLLAIVLVSKKIWRRSPFFTAYGLVNLLQIVGCYALRGKPVSYFYWYWLCEAVAVVLGLAIVYEVFDKLLVLHEALRQVATRMFRVAVLVLLALGILVIWLHAPFQHKGIEDSVFVVTEAARVLEVGGLLFLFLFSTAFGLHWRQSTFGVALGLGMFAAVELIAVAMRSQFGVSIEPALNVVHMVAFNISLLIWIGYLLVPERVTSSAELPKRSQLEQWNQAVMELIRQ